MSDDIQSAFNNALAQVYGYRDAKAMMMAVPEDRRLPGNVTVQEQFNHAAALMVGFDSVDDMVAANGLNGTRGLKSKQF